MRSDNDGSTPVDPTPAPSAAPSNAFDAEFLSRLDDRNEPPFASEADLAGPWHIERLPEGGGYGLFRLAETLETGFRPRAVFADRWRALLAQALLIALGRSPAYRLRSEAEEGGYALESQEEWGGIVGHLAFHDPDLVTGLSLLDALARSPYSLALCLEAFGKVTLEHAGTILHAQLAVEE